MRVFRVDFASGKVFGMNAEGVYDASKKNLSIWNTFYPNAYTPGTFKMFTYGRGPAAK